MNFNFSDDVIAGLKQMSSKYIWWKTPDEVIDTPERIISQVMNIGDYDDVQVLVKLVGNDVLRQTILSAEAGQFNERSWTYWHYRLDLSELERVPEMPRRRFN